MPSNSWITLRFASRKAGGRQQYSLRIDRQQTAWNRHHCHGPTVNQIDLDASRVRGVYAGDAFDPGIQRERIGNALGHAVVKDGYFFLEPGIANDVGFDVGVNPLRFAALFLRLRRQTWYSGCNATCR